MRNSILVLFVLVVTCPAFNGASVYSTVVGVPTTSWDKTK
jgi:hypothetical protein